MLRGAVTMLRGLDGAVEGAFDGALGRAPVCVEDGMKVEVWSEE